MTINFICGVIAELFDSPCNFSPIDEYMFQDNFCESHCGEVADKDCWKRYFEKRWEDSKMSEIPNSSENPNNCDTCRNKGFEGCEQPCLGCGCCGLYEPKTEPLDKDTNVRSKDCETCLYRDYPWDTPICDSCTTTNSHYESDLSEDEFKDIFKGFDREALILLIKNQRERISKLQSKVEGNPHIDDLIKQADSLIEFEKELLKNEPQTDDAYSYDEDDWYDKTERSE